MSEYPLPKEIADALGRNPRSDNFGLLFSRLQKVKTPSEKKDDKEKYRIWESLMAESLRIFSRKNADGVGMPEALDGLHKRLDNLEKAYRKIGYARFEDEFTMKVDWRLVVGIGNPSVLETGLRLHSIYGFPYLPGPGLKGAIRNSWMNEAAARLGIYRLSPAEIVERNGKTPWKFFENLLVSGKKESAAAKNAFANLKSAAGIEDLHFKLFFREYVLKYQALFGNANGQGSVNFLDVLPTRLAIDEMVDGKSVRRSILEVDIINPHYAPYYAGDAPPADWHSPKPIFFMAIRKNTPLRFRVLAKNKDLLNEVKKLIAATANDYGLGAKTTAGYGEMYLDDEEKV